MWEWSQSFVFQGVFVGDGVGVADSTLAFSEVVFLSVHPQAIAVLIIDDSKIPDIVPKNSNLICMMLSLLVFCYSLIY